MRTLPELDPVLLPQLISVRLTADKWMVMTSMAGGNAHRPCQSQIVNGEHSGINRPVHVDGNLLELPFASIWFSD